MVRFVGRTLGGRERRGDAGFSRKLRDDYTGFSRKLRETSPMLSLRATVAAPGHRHNGAGSTGTRSQWVDTS
jgi:hypothetical protein